MNAISGTFIFVSFFLLVWLMFGGLLDITTVQTDSIRESSELYEERLSTQVSITSTSISACGYIATVHNRSDGVSFGDFSQIDPCFFLHNDPTPSTGDTVSQSLLPMDEITS